MHHNVLPDRHLPAHLVMACLGALLLGTVSAPSHAQAPAAPVAAQADASSWTGTPQSPEIMRKEAGAALVEGRRECARERNAEARAACLRIVNADHAAMLAQIAGRGKKPAK